MTTRHIFFIFTLLLTAITFAQGQVCTAGVLNMHQLRLFAQPHSSPFGLSPTLVRPISRITPILYKEKEIAEAGIFLPQWTAADLPVFCRIEHEIGKKMPMLIKFRLGSVEYVDWLEGK